MKKACSKLPWYKWLRYRPWCEAYYLGVRAMGWKYFYFTETPRELF